MEQINEDIQILHTKNPQNDYIIKSYNSLQNWNKTSQEKYIISLLELQKFKADSDSIWVSKFSHNGKYIATGGKTGVLKIWEVLSINDSIDSYEPNNIKRYLNFISEDAFRIYTEHKKDIIDISWSEKNQNLLVTVSLDHYAILWDINIKTSLKIYAHDSMVTCVDFYPNVPILFNEITNKENDLFVTGCFDRIIRIWSVYDEKNIMLYVNVIEYITAISFFPEGNNLALGSSDGKILIYDCMRNLRYLYSFNCRNKSGKFSNGKKITNIQFKNIKEVFITTNDSRIRLINITDGTVIKKFKGYINNETMLRADYEENNGMIISPSDDGYNYIWDCNRYGNIKNNEYEYYKPFDKKSEGLVTCALFTYDFWLGEYNHKIQKVSKDIYIKGIMISASSKGFVNVVMNWEQFPK